MHIVHSYATIELLLIFFNASMYYQGLLAHFVYYLIFV